MHSLESQPHSSNRSPTQPSIELAQSEIHFLTQDDCFKHVFRRSKDVSCIFERPERLRFVNLGLAAAIAWDWVNNRDTADPPRLLTPFDMVHSEVSASGLDFESNSSFSLIQTSQVTFSKSNRKVSSNDPAFEKVHDQPNEPTALLSSSKSVAPAPTAQGLSKSNVATTGIADFQNSTNYFDQLIGLCRRASELHHLGLSEVPDHLPQGDLYLSLGSEAAILGAVGSCYAAIDSIFKVDHVKLESASASASTQMLNRSPSYKKAFVNIRPPGHHCTNSEPMGFCWVNNVLISCIYSYLNYAIDRICIVDIDLHHGNGSQQIVWNLNSQSASLWSEKSATSAPVTQDPSSSPIDRRPLLISYSSLHDINSYPCEDGDPDRIKEASLNICAADSINQFIQNLHIEDWNDEEDFYERLYPKTWTAFESHMLKFFKITDARPDRSLIFISAGFDACEYETGQMSRYAKKLPASFFYRFARDIGRFSALNCQGKSISVLEGGYSEHTLTGSTLSYMLGSMDNSINRVDPEDEFPWSSARINQLLKLCKKGDSNRKFYPTNKTTAQQESLAANHSKDNEWIAATRRLFEHIDSYDEFKSEMNKSMRLEEKQAKLQQAMSQVALEVRSPDGLRRSQRHASSTKKSETSSSMTDEVSGKTMQEPSESNTPPLKSPQLSSCTTNAPLDKSSLLPIEPSDHQGTINRNNGQITTIIQDKPFEKSTLEQKDQSIDELLGNLKLAEAPECAKVERNSQSGIKVLMDQSKLTNITPTATTTTTEASKMPKVKLVWKAGGIS